jgi:tetrahydromethanopterin S-methyltransferase subunit G
MENIVAGGLLRRQDEFDHVHERLAEVEERVDFAERVLARKSAAPGT